MNVVKNDDGDITLENEDHSISFSFNRIVTPETEEEKTRNKMISDVMTTPRNRKMHLMTWSDAENALKSRFS